MIKLRYLVFVLLLLFSFIIQAQNPDTWSRVRDFGGTPRYGNIAFSIGGLGYVGLGLYQADTFPYPRTYFNDLWQYNPSTDTWVQKASFPGVGRINSVCFVIGSKAYVGLGYNEIINPFGRSDFWEYDPATDTWTQKASFAGTARQYAAGFSIGSKGYAGLGSADSGLDTRSGADFWEYDPLADSWTRKADCPGWYETLGFSIGDRGYAGFGRDTVATAFIPLKAFWEYDPVANAWMRKADYAGKAKGLCNSFSFSIGNRGYVGTGIDSTASTDRISDFWEYNSLTDTWIEKDSFGGGARGGGAGFSIGNKGYAGTGYSPYVGYTFADFWKYTPDSITTGISALDENAISISPNPVNDKLYISNLPQDATLALSDMTGRSFSLPISGNEIDISSLPAGMYCLHIQNSRDSFIRRFVKE